MDASCEVDDKDKPAGAGDVDDDIEKDAARERRILPPSRRPR